MKNLLFVLVTVFGLTACGGGGGGSSSGGGTGGSGGNRAPSASFTVACADLDCTFTNNSTDSDGTVASSSWNFGDGATATTTDANHTFGSYGSYTVSLTVTDNDGATGSANRSVAVTIDIHAQVVSIDMFDPSIVFKQDFDHRVDGDYTPDQLLEDMCPADELVESTCGKGGFYYTEMVIENGEFKFTSIPNEGSGANIFKEFADGIEYQVMYLTYMVRVSSNYDSNSDMKMHGLGGSVPGEAPPTGGVGSRGPDGGFSSRFNFNSGTFKQYIYHPNQAGSFGDSYYINNFTYNPNVEYVIEMKVTMNEPGSSNGKVESFINGVHVLTTDGFSFSETGAYGINTFFFNLETSLNVAPNTASTVWMDDFVLSTERVVIPN